MIAKVKNIPGWLADLFKIAWERKQVISLGIIWIVFLLAMVWDIVIRKRIG